MSDADDIVREIADDPEPIRFVPGLYGQGGGGNQCRWCHADDYDRLIHKPSCKWVRARRVHGLASGLVAMPNVCLVHIGRHVWKNGAELVWECADSCPHTDHDAEGR